MRIPGPSEASLRLVGASYGAGRGAGPEAGLKAGAVVSIVVRERLSPDPGRPAAGELYRIAIGQRLYTATAAGLGAGALEPGTLLKARVERSGDAILLRVAGRELGEGPAAALSRAISAAALPNDAAARAAFAALAREGMAPEPRALARVRRAAQREAAEGGEWTDLAAKMEAKGIPAEFATLEGLAASSDGRAGSREGEGRGERQEEREAECVSLEVPEAELPRALGTLLRALSVRLGGAAQDGALALFNHLRGPEGSWVIVPFRFALDAVDFAGCFRIQLPYVRGGSGLFEARFSASRGSSAEDWSFFLSFGGGRATALRIERPEGEAGSRIDERFGEFAAELAAMSCSALLSRRGEGAGAGRAGLDLDA